jgi:hypothetical protein
MALSEEITELFKKDGKGYIQAQVYDLLKEKHPKLTKDAVSKAMQRLVAKGVLLGIGTTINRYFILVSEDVRKLPLNDSKLLSEADTINEQVSRVSEATKQYRNHATYLEYPLEHYSKEALATLCSKKSIDFKQWAARNNYPLFMFLGDYEVRLYNRSLIVVPPDRALAQAEALPFNLTQEVLKDAWGLAERLSKALSLVFTQIGGFYVGALVRQELAQTNNELAAGILPHKELKAGARTFRIIDPDTDRKCFEFDDSPPDNPAAWFRSLQEAEATDPANADKHATEAHIFLDKVLHKRLNAQMDDDHAKIGAFDLQMEKVADLLVGITQANEVMARNQITHLPMIQEDLAIKKELLQVLADIRAERTQAKLQPEPKPSLLGRLKLMFK